MGKKIKNSSSLFFSGVLILAISNLIIKVIGVTLKIPLHSLLDDDGMFFYNTAYEIYVWFYMISTAGLPVAVSIMISESRAKGNFAEVKKIFRITMTLFIIVGLIGTFILWFGAHAFADAYKMELTYLSIRAIAPTLFFICISSAIRGFYQGYQNMLPTAISQLIEAVGKLSIGIAFALYAINRGYEKYQIAAFTILGLTIGVLLGMIYLVVSKAFFRSELYDAEYASTPCTDCVRGTKVLLKTLVVIAIPITLSSSVMSFSNMIDGMIISRQLQAIGYTEKMVETVYGNYKTLAVSMFNFPPALIYPISYSIVPLLSSAIARNDSQRIKIAMNSTFKVVSLIALPCTFGLAVLAEPILSLLFNKNSADMAAPYLAVLSCSLLFLGMVTVSNAMLQAYKLERKPIISMIAGCLVKVAVSYILVGTPGIELYGAPISTFACYFVILAINLYFMHKHIGIMPNFVKIFVKPLIAGAVCGAAAIGAFKLFDAVVGGKISTILAVAVAAFVYLIAIFLIRAIDEDDIKMLPKGKKIYSILCRLHIFKAEKG
ncbi:MAG: polysaccharide biosynthesis protein [Ruminococcaceae bacterium]|nr:polysaccharide biosynthesis protein [Oscillospiraceae bacterium]